MTDDLHSLAAELPEGAVLGPDDDLSSYEQPWRGDRGAAAFVARPGTVEQLRTVVRWAVRHRVPFVTQGANTGLVGASVPGASGAVGVLSTARLLAPLDVHVADRAVTAGAGVLMSAVEQAVAPHGLELPVDLSADASLGGLVATNAGGCRVLRHGDVRQRLLGVQVVLADDDATVLGDLRPLRKKNDTLRLTDLVVGSAGLLGVVTAATLELAYRPAGRATAFVLPAGPLLGGVCRPGASARGRGSGALELVSGEALRLPSPHVDAVATRFPARRRTWCCWSRSRATTPRTPRTRWSRRSAELGVLVEDAAVLPPERAWGLRHGVSEALARSRGRCSAWTSRCRGRRWCAARAEAADVVRRARARRGARRLRPRRRRRVAPQRRAARGLRPRGRDGAAAGRLRAGRPARRVVLRRARARAGQRRLVGGARAAGVPGGPGRRSSGRWTRTVCSGPRRCATALTLDDAGGTT